MAAQQIDDLPRQPMERSRAHTAVPLTHDRKSVRARLAFASKLIVGVMLVGVLLWHYNLASIVRLICAERPDFFVGTVVLFIAGQVMSAFRWQLLARLNGIDGPFREYLAYYFIGMFTNVFVPGLIGGDALRALYLGRRRGRISEAFASVLADRGVGLMALFWFAAAAVCISSVRLPPSVVRATVAAGVAAAIVYCCGPLAARLAYGIGGRLARLTTPLMVYLRRPFALIPAILLSLLLQLSLAMCQYLLAAGLKLSISLATFVLVVPIANVVASLPVTINGLGMREASYVMLLSMAGVGREQAVALSLLYFAATLAGSLIGVVPFIRTPMPLIEPTPTNSRDSMGELAGQKA